MESSKTKVLIVIPHLRTGGGQKVAFDIAINIKDPKVEICMLSLYAREGSIFERKADDAGLKTFYLNKKPGMDLKCIRDIYQILKEYKPDVIHAHLRVMPYLLLPMILCKPSKRFYTVHNLAEKDENGISRKILAVSFRYAKVCPVAISDLCRKSIFLFV